MSDEIKPLPEIEQLRDQRDNLWRERNSLRQALAARDETIQARNDEIARIHDDYASTIGPKDETIRELHEGIVDRDHRLADTEQALYHSDQQVRHQAETNAKLEQRLAGQEALLEACLRQLNPAPDGRCSRMAAGMVPCRLYGGIPFAIQQQAQRITELENLLKRAGLQCFLSNGTPEEVAIHMEAVAASHIRHEQEQAQRIKEYRDKYICAESLSKRQTQRIADLERELADHPQQRVARPMPQSPAKGTNRYSLCQGTGMMAGEHRVTDLYEQVAEKQEDTHGS